MDVNVSEVGETVPSPVSVLDRVIVTSLVGWVSSTTVNVAVPAASVVDRPEVGVTITPAASAGPAPSVRASRASAPARRSTFRGGACSRAVVWVSVGSGGCMSPRKPCVDCGFRHPSTRGSNRPRPSPARERLSGPRDPRSCRRGAPRASALGPHPGPPHSPSIVQSNCRATRGNCSNRREITLNHRYARPAKPASTAGCATAPRPGGEIPRRPGRSLLAPGGRGEAVQEPAAEADSRWIGSSPAATETLMLLLFSTTLFLSAALLFAVQPMFGRMVLPLLGGSPSVWNTVMVFNQVMLMVGYAYAHALARRGARAWGFHLALLLLGLSVLPLHLRPDQIPPANGSPVLWLLWTMMSTVALPFLLLSTTGPLLQRWFAHTRHAHASDPYFLYAASNVGSMLGLIAYPFLLEPRWALHAQSRGWAVGYLVLLLLIAACAWATRKAASGEPEVGAPDVAADEARPALGRRLRWLALAFAPSSLMLGVTTHLTMDLVSMPLLWIVPLAVYLLTFILAFARRDVVPAGVLARIRTYAVLGVLIVIVSHASEPVWFVAALHLTALFALGLTCHRAMAHDRPGVSHLTEFYLCVAAGGALGGVFNALIAPRVFTSVAEYPLVVVLACLLAPAWPIRAVAAGQAPEPAGAARPRRELARDLVVSLAVGAVVFAAILVPRALGHEWRRVELVLLVAALCFPLFAFRRRSLRFGLVVGTLLLVPQFARESERTTLHAERSFFGIHRVQSLRTADGLMHRLVHGTTLHGVQWIEPRRCEEPLSYYHRGGPGGQVFAEFGRASRASRIGIVGLGTGATIAFAEPGQQWTYFEIDPAVVRIASNPDWFCFLANAQVRPRIVLGDARLSLAADTTRYDLLVLDAYTSDAIPVHLLTREALREYFGHLTPHGVLALHLSNRHFDLEPVVARLARDAGFSPRLRVEGKPSAADQARGYESSSWAVIAR